MGYQFDLLKKLYLIKWAILENKEKKFLEIKNRELDHFSIIFEFMKKVEWTDLKGKFHEKIHSKHWWEV
jgi:hypothetical protein